MTEQVLELLTELSAVNMMLAAIGESPVNSIDDTGLADAVIARNTLRNVSRQVQNRGYIWNTVDEFVLLPDEAAGNILKLPSNTLRAAPSGTDVDRDVVQRGDRLFDRENNTTAFTDSLTISYTTLLPFDSLPSAARDYIAVTAAKQFQQERLGSAQLSEFERQIQADAWRQLRRDEVSASRTNMLTGSWSAARMLQNRR